MLDFLSVSLFFCGLNTFVIKFIIIMYIFRFLFFFIFIFLLGVCAMDLLLLILINVKLCKNGCELSVTIYVVVEVTTRIRVLVQFKNFYGLNWTGL